MEGRWWTSERQGFLEGMKSPFQKGLEVSNRAKAASSRESNISTFMKRVTPQILEYIELNLPWTTPEEWDSSFYALGGGPKGGGRIRYKSGKILEKVSWEKFLELSNKFLEDRT